MSLDRIKEYMTKLCRDDFCDPTEIMKTYCEFAAYIMANPDHVAATPAWRTALRQKATELRHLDGHMRRLVRDGYDVKAMKISEIFLRYIDEFLPLNHNYVA